MYVISERLFRIGEDSDITNEAGQPVLRVDGRVEVSGDLLSHEFTIDREGQAVATISKRWLSLTAGYAVEVAPGEDDVLILASVLALDLAIDAEHN